MKSLKVINVMLGRNLGGIEQSFVNYLMAFDHLRYKSVGIISNNAEVQQIIPKNIEIKSIYNFGEWDIFSALSIRNIINKIKPNIIITHGRRAAKLVKPVSMGVPVIGVAHNYSIEHLLKLDYVFAITNDLANCLIEMKYVRDKIFHIPNMITTKTFSTTAPTKFHPIPIIGGMGRLVHRKGFDLFIRALSILKDEGIKFRAILAGDGEEKSNLIKLARDLHIDASVEFPGWIEDKAKFFSSIDIFCLPSRVESFGIVLLEAMLFHKPTVTFVSQGPSEIGTDCENVLFAESGNERDLADKLQLLIEDKALASKLAKAGPELVRKKYTLEVICAELDRVTKHVVKMTNQKLHCERS